jgi:ubiquinone biosynthesis monooxygenase Coq7
MDSFLIGLDQALRTVFGRPAVSQRPSPAARFEEVALDESERRHIARLMRINHTGEVSAQGLYQGQALTARDAEIRDALERSAEEETDHLAWCEERLQQLDDRKSLLNPLWYAGSFAMGALAGIAGDRYSLGFVVETERQVESHLEGHLKEIPSDDAKTRAIIRQMKADEIHHAQTARDAGSADLPAPIRWAMKGAAKVMTRTVYWI